MSRYIDADALRNAMYNKAFETDTKMQRWDSGCWIRYKLFETVLEEQPSADVVEVLHGKWSPRTNLPKQEIFICSVCGGWTYSPWIGNRKNPKPNWCKYKYCPNCGAKMEVTE